MKLMDSDHGPYKQRRRISFNQCWNETGTSEVSKAALPDSQCITGAYGQKALHYSCKYYTLMANDLPI